MLNPEALLAAVRGAAAALPAKIEKAIAAAGIKDDKRCIPNLP
jgi:hypothetical protein